MRSAKVNFLGNQVEVFYSGSGSDLYIDEIVGPAGEEIELPDFATPQSVFLYADVARADYEANAEALEAATEAGIDFISSHVQFVQVGGK